MIKGVNSSCYKKSIEQHKRTINALKNVPECLCFCEVYLPLFAAPHCLASAAYP